MNNLFSVKDKVILITGASSGLGCHFARVLALAGAKVALGARRLDRLERIASEITQNSGVVFINKLDVTQVDEIKQFVSGTLDRLGPIDVLINNAGVDARTNLFETNDADWTPVIETNLKGAVLMTQAVAPHLIKNKKGGSIINISSVSDVLAFKGGNPAYMLSKAGIAHFTHLLSLELAEFNIRANTIAPGVFQTEINEDLFGTDISKALEQKIPLQKFGELHDLDGVLFLLCSDASRYMTGTTIRVDGGLGVNKLQL